MRILQLLNRIPWPLNDGGAIGYYNFIKGYHDAGCEVTVAAFNTTKHQVDHLPLELTQIAKFYTVELDNRIQLIPAFLNLFTSESYHISRFKTKQFKEELEHLLTLNTYDVIICESLFMAQYIETIRSNSKALIVLRQHNVEHEIWGKLANGTSNWLKKSYLKLLAKRLLKFEQNILNQFDALTAVTSNDKVVFTRMGCHKPILVAPLGIDFPLPNPNNNAVLPNSLFHIGSMEWEPNKEGIEWFLSNVWTTVSNQFPHAHLFLAGKKMGNLPFLKKFIRVINDGEIENAHDYMLSKQIMIIPLLSGSGIRVKILEGMALGKAIIATTLGAQGINYTHQKDILIADTPDEFCQCIRQLMDNPVLCRSLGKEAQRLIASEYSNSKVIGDVLGFYRTQINLKKELLNQ